MENGNERKATIKDICAKTGLALGTVSKYLNGGTLKADNAEKIQKAIDELDYKVDIFARALKTKKTNTVGVLLPELGNAFYGSITSSIGKELQKHGYEMIVKESNYSIDRENESLQWFVERRCDGIICFITTNNKLNLDIIRNYPIICIDREIANLNIESVNVNNREIVKESIKYLISQGHKKVAGLFPINSYTSGERQKGFRDAFKEMNIILNDEDIIYFDEAKNNESDVINEVLENEKYTAIFTSNYTSTISAMFMINERKIKIPEEISIIGFDNIMFTKLFTPKLTIISQPLDEIAYTAVNRLLNIINNKTQKKKNTFLKCELIYGDSVKCLDRD